MRFDFGLEQVTLELSQKKENVLWIPAIPARELKAYQGRRISITESYLKAAASETKRFYSDLDSRGSDYRRPILCSHDDAGRRSGSLLDFAVRAYKGVATLFVKGLFLDEAYNAIVNGSLAHGSISIVPEYTDPESGNTYAPFIAEWSETHSPVVKGFTVSELFESPSQLAALNLTLSEDNMENEEMGSVIAQIKEAVAEMLIPINERLDALETGEEQAEEVEEEIEEAPKVEASEDANVLDFVALSEKIKSLETKLERVERVRAKGPQISTPGVPIAASEKKKPKLSRAQKVAKLKKEDPSLYGINLVNALTELENE